MALRSKIDEIRKRWAAEGRLRQLPDAEVTKISREIRREMRIYRQELALLEAKSIEDASKIIINA